MGHIYKTEFRRDSVHLVLSSGLSREHIAQDLGIGSSTFKKWIRDAQKHNTVVANATDHTALFREDEREDSSGRRDTIDYMLFEKLVAPVLAGLTTSDFIPKQRSHAG